MSKADIPREDVLSSGSTLLNLACSGLPDVAFTKGRYFWMVGDSSSGKTVLLLTVLAEAARNSNWDEYDLIFDNVEDGALMNIEKFYGAKLAKRLKPPSIGKNGEPVFSSSTEDFYFVLDTLLTEVEKNKRPPFIYLLDSMDALTTDYEQKKFAEKKKASEGGPAAKGDYGDGKAKLNSTYLRTVVGRLRETRCTLIILSQTRDNVDGGMFEPAKTHAGGHALKFYATFQLWSSNGGKITKTVQGRERQVGIYSKIRILKNRLSGKDWTVTLPIYHSYGIDNVGANVDFLVDEKRWVKSGTKVEATEFGVSLTRDKLISHIEDNGLEIDLERLVTEHWDFIESSCELERKPRFS